jgi:dihydrofolate synthase/folylpolyglutamate synthase
MTLGLANIRSLLSRLGEPQRAFRTVVVAGTNGKGSVTAMAASVLGAQGLTVGRFTSPHVYSVAERVCINGNPVGLDDLEAAAARVAPLHAEIGFSYFEAITAIAFLVFAERGVDIAVLETGLGGRFDATNVTDPEVSVVTSISLDHRRILGDTEEEILREKLGITRGGVPLLLGPLSESMVAIAREKSARDGFDVVTHDELALAEVVDARLDGTVVRLRTPACDYGEVTVPFGGAHQVINAVLAVGAAERVSGPLHDLRTALASAYLPGRFERFDVAGKAVVLDVAHNEAALDAAFALLGSVSPRQRSAVVLGLMRRKELFGVPQRLLSAAARHYLVAPSTPDAHEPQELLSRYAFRHLTDARADVILWHRASSRDDHWRRLVDALTQPSNPAEVILVTGSHHVVEEFGRALFARGDHS